MSRKGSKITNWSAWLLLFVAFGSILAPIRADAYLCPMAKAALEHKPSCCAHETMAPASPPGTQQFQATCRCPKLHWDAASADRTQESPCLRHHATGLIASLPAFVTTCSPSRATRLPVAATAQGSGPPLWVLHQAILC